MSDDPVSWFLIERGWKVVDAAGAEVGSVDEIVGDSGDDIFNGLAVSTSLLGRPRYVPSEQVGLITDGRVQLRLSKEEAERLGEFEEPPTTAQILPDSASAIRRAEASIEAPIHSHEERVNFVTRVRDAFRRLFGR
ncbi:MAG TPA: DUF2171 domain-containing protein [Gaiellaceae bacterium]|nr:DUF2171 domain-containing protein [Gaiellaceae bacterium]